MGEEAHATPSEKTKKDEEVRSTVCSVHHATGWLPSAGAAVFGNEADSPFSSVVNQYVTKHLDARALFSFHSLHFHFYKSSPRQTSEQVQLHTPPHTLGCEPKGDAALCSVEWAQRLRQMSCRIAFIFFTSHYLFIFDTFASQTL